VRLRSCSARLPRLTLEANSLQTHRLNPPGHWNGTDLASFAVEVENDPSLITLLHVFKLQFGEFRT
jgi:hypothetical protein